jgi:hypothetical protein
MDSDNTSLVIVLMAIVFPFLALLLLIGLVVILVRGRRKHWQATATSLGLQSDPMCMYGFRGLPVRIFWQNEGQRVGQLDWDGAIFMGRHDMRGGRAGLRYTYCRALLEPPLRLGLNVARNIGAPADASSIRTGRALFDNAFTLTAREGLQAQRLFLSPLADDFALVAQSGWQLSATDNYVQVRLGGDYGTQVAGKAQLYAALDTVVHCGQRLLSARRTLPKSAEEQNVITSWERCAPRLGLTADQAQTMLTGTYAGLQAEVYADCIQAQEWRTVFTVKLPRPVGFALYLTRKSAADRILGPRGIQVLEKISLADPIVEQAFEACGRQQSSLAQALTPQARQQLQRLCQKAADVLIEDGKVQASAPGFLTEASELQEILDSTVGMASAMR